MFTDNLVIHRKDLMTYDTCHAEMTDLIRYLARQDCDQPAQLWFLEHMPVYTCGFATLPRHFSHLSDPFDRIPMVFSDRGGQVTYHGPGQLIIYMMVNVKKLFASSPKCFVHFVVESLSLFFAQYKIEAQSPAELPPGLYVPQGKFVSMGFKFHHGWSYHGVAINVDMDMSPFFQITPCGQSSIPMTQIKDICPSLNYNKINQELAPFLCERLTNAERLSCLKK